MIGFLLEEGVLTVGTLSGLFTTGLLNSLKLNIIDPCIENIIPSPTPPPPPPPPPPPKSEENASKSQFGDMFPIPFGPPPSPQVNKKDIKWKVFLKDFFTWLLIMFCLFLFWKNVLHPIKIRCQKVP